MLAPSFITRALWRAWQKEHVLWGLHQPLACCFMQFSQMYQSSRQDPAIWTAFTASWANSQEMFNNVPCTSVARSRFLEWRVAKRNPGSASLQLLVTCWFCCYCLRACFCKGSLRLRFPKRDLRCLEHARVVPDEEDECEQQDPSLELVGLGSAAGLGHLPSTQSRAELNSAAAQTLCSLTKGVWAITEQMPVQTGILVGPLATSPGYRIQSGMLTSVLESKRGSAEYSWSAPNCLTLKY